MLDALLFLLCLSPPLIHASCNGLNCTTVQLSRQSGYLGNPCSPSPCGPNTWCKVSPRHSWVAQCHCLDGFFPDEHTIKGCKPQCTSDDDCDDDYRCQRTKCVRVCGPGSCGANANCEADDHEPKCSCKPGYTGDPDRYCRRDDNQLSQLEDDPSSRQKPCEPNPCGVNAECRTSSLLQAMCSCPRGYRGDPYIRCSIIAIGCKAQSACGPYLACQNRQCVDPCAMRNVCGRNAECTTINHAPTCSCPPGTTGNPISECLPLLPGVSQFEDDPLSRHDPCQPNPCGVNAQCRTSSSGLQAICSCPRGYLGDPMLRCTRGECVESRDCPPYLVCQGMQCVDPCSMSNVCGRDAECTTINHTPTCSCPPGLTGDPLNFCRIFDPKELCEPSPCGAHTTCKVRTNPDNRAVCSCKEGYIGNPLVACRPECERHSDCPSRMACEANRCVNPCMDACGPNAYCDVHNGRAVCSCPRNYKGNPERGCYAECLEHTQCPSFQACYQLECVDPCIGSCGVDASCRVQNHYPICSCPKGYTGHPFERCRPFTDADYCTPNPCGTNAECKVGLDKNGEKCPVCSCPRGFIGNALISCQRGDCETDNHCPRDQVCHQYTCQDPCHHLGKSVCGTNANCVVRNRRPECSCPPGYFGDARQECYTRAKEVYIQPN